MVQVAGDSIEVQHKDMNERIEGLRQSLDSVTERSLVARAPALRTLPEIWLVLLLS